MIYIYNEKIEIKNIENKYLYKHMILKKIEI